MIFKWLIQPTYVYELEKIYEIYLPELTGLSIDFPYASIKNSVLTIHKGYAWNGCSPKWLIFGTKIIGTTDGPIDYKTGKPLLYYASLVHDVLYQYKFIERKIADKIFYRLLLNLKFFLADDYYQAVRLFGPRWKKHIIK